MGRPLRTTVQGIAYHVLNRRVMRLPIFDKPADYEAFEGILAQALRRPDALQLLAFCLMPNHWHLVLWPQPGSNLSTWMQWLTVTHTHRWHQHYHCVGEGALYQGRFKSFPVQRDAHLLTAMRYVEANALRAGLVRRAEEWRWGSLSIRRRGPAQRQALLSPAPVPLPDNWPAVVNRAPEPAELQAVRHSVIRSAPLGSKAWVERTVRQLGLQATQRQRGRPRKREKLVAVAEAGK